MQKTLNLLFLILFFYSSYSQENNEFKPSGKIFVKIFTNYNSSLVEGKPVHNAFEVEKANFGYKYNLSKKICGKIAFDVTDPGVGSLKNTTFLKHAYFEYKNKKLTAKFGMIGRYQFKIQEEMWGRRYLFKSFQHQYDFGDSADKGIFASYKFSKLISWDFAIENGEGEKTFESDSILKYGTGFVFSPAKWIETRGYYDFMGKTTSNAQQTFSSYIGFKFDKIKIGTEYNYQLNNKIQKKHNFGGYSIYTSYQLKKIAFFGRFDNLNSVKIDGEDETWNFAENGQKIIAGIEYSPIKGFTISPNYQSRYYQNNNPTEHTLYISCEIKF